MSTDAATAIQQTKNWITSVVVGLNLCPFAAREVKHNTIHYEVSTATHRFDALDALLAELKRLDAHPEIETSFLLFTEGFSDFQHYLSLLSQAEQLLRKKKYEGIYQIASFHPDYLFAGADENDASHFTNRSIFPMFHLLREASLEAALKSFPNPESIPERNVELTRSKGLAYMKMLREACLS